MADAHADEIEALSRAMGEAVARGDYEAASALRDRLNALGAGSKLRRETPGRMGLGTDTQAMAPPKGWKPPPKPDLMTTNRKPPRGRG